jgi:hypothetical protein
LFLAASKIGTFNTSDGFGFYIVVNPIDDSIIYGSRAIIVVNLSIKRRIVTLVLSASRNGAFNSPDSFDLSTVRF